MAIKAVSRQKLTTKLLENLESEINILKAISHRNIVSLEDCFVCWVSSLRSFPQPISDVCYHVFRSERVDVYVIPFGVPESFLSPPLCSTSRIPRGAHTHPQKNDTHIYLVMEYCTGSDLSIYIKNRGKLPTLDFVPRPGMALSGSYPSEGDKVFWPHPLTGGLDERVTRCFLGQLGE